MGVQGEPHRSAPPSTPHLPNLIPHHRSPGLAARWLKRIFEWTSNGTSKGVPRDARLPRSNNPGTRRSRCPSSYTSKTALCGVSPYGGGWVTSHTQPRCPLTPHPAGTGRLPKEIPFFSPRRGRGWASVSSAHLASAVEQASARRRGGLNRWRQSFCLP